MSEGQINRKVGQGMKRRGGKRVSVPKETKAVIEKPTTEGQPEGVKEAVLETQDQAQTPPNLEPEIEAAAEPETGDLGASVADTDHAPEMTPEGEALLKAMLESKDPADDIDMTKALETGNIKTGIVGVSEVDPKSVNLKELEAAFGGASFKNATKPAAFWLGESSLGPQPDGSHKVAVTIQEGYWEAVQQWAEADGVPVEEWLSARLYEYVSTYGQAPRGR